MDGYWFSEEKYKLQREVDELRAQLAEKDALIQRLRMEAQIHAQEARTQRATVLESYQIASDKQGEPGDWHGAEPVRRLKEQLAEAQADKEWLIDLIRDFESIPYQQFRVKYELPESSQWLETKLTPIVASYLRRREADQYWKSVEERAKGIRLKKEGA